MVLPIASVPIFLLYPQSRQNAFLSPMSSVLGKGKNQWGPRPVNTVVEALLRFDFWPKTHTQASTYELVYYIHT